MIAAAAIAAAAAVREGQQARRNANQNMKELQYQREQGLADAQAEREGAEVRAGLVRKAGRYQISSARAGLAKSGVAVGSGSAQAVQDYIREASEQDALTEILNGNYRARRMESGAAAYDRKSIYTDQAGDAAQQASYLKAGSSLLGAYSGGASSGWRPQVSEQVPGQFSTMNRQYG